MKNHPKTLAELKRYLQPGVKLILAKNYGKEVNMPRTILSLQSNGLFMAKRHATLEELKGLGRRDGSFLDYPKATLLTLTENGFSIYGEGLRELTKQEKAIMDNEPKDAKQEEIDMLSDGSQMFWRRKAYYKEKNASYLQGFDWQNGMRYDHNTSKVKDTNIKGEPILEYTYL